MRAITVGLCIVIVSFSLIAVGVLSKTIGTSAIYISWMAVLVSASVTAYMASDRKFMNGILLSLPVSLMLGLSNYVFSLAGYPSDFGGFIGTMALMAILLPCNVIACAIGAFAGVVVFNFYCKRKK